MFNIFRDFKYLFCKDDIFNLNILFIICKNKNNKMIVDHNTNYFKTMSLKMH